MVFKSFHSLHFAMVAVGMFLVFFRESMTHTNRFNHSVQPGRADNSCSFFYAPCECYTYVPAGEIKILCKDVTPQEVFDLFHQDTLPVTEITYFVFEMSDPLQTRLPANILGSYKVLSSIDLKWTGPNEKGLLTVDPDAFRASKETLSFMNVEGFDARNLNWMFLGNYNELVAFHLADIDHMNNFTSLPILSRNVTSIYFYNCTELKDIPEVSAKLVNAEFHNSSINDEVADNILKKLLKVNSTLENLSIVRAPLSFIPREIRLFTHIKLLKVSGTDVPFIREGTFEFNPSRFGLRNLRSVYLNDNKIKSIELGAFSGNMSYTLLHLENNELTRLEEAVFQPILNDMFWSTQGGLYLKNNLFECDCGLAWLIRDNRHLLDYVFDATCSDSTLFIDLKSDDFLDCTY